jgi:hypothetical protein
VLWPEFALACDHESLPTVGKDCTRKPSKLPSAPTMSKCFIQGGRLWSRQLLPSFWQWFAHDSAR